MSSKGAAHLVGFGFQRLFRVQGLGFQRLVGYVGDILGILEKNMDTACQHLGFGSRV